MTPAVEIPKAGAIQIAEMSVAFANRLCVGASDTCLNCTEWDPVAALHFAW